jgi:predicted  nucleic acid-binding Zn-ribbon protein
MIFTSSTIGALELYVGPIAAELAHKRAELAVLRQRLAEREAELADFEAALSDFEMEYRRALGQRYAVLDDLAERIEQAKLDQAGRGAGDQDDADRRVDRDGDSDPSENGQNWEWAWGEREPEHDFRRIVSAEAKRLFRLLARRIHPDLAGDPAERERRTNLMVAANNAYEQGEIETLRHLLDEWDASPDSVAGSSPTSELERLIRHVSRIQARLEALDKRFADLESSAMGWLRRRVDKAASEGWDLLSHMVKELDRQIAEARVELERIELERANAQIASA